MYFEALEKKIFFCYFVGTRIFWYKIKIPFPSPLKLAGRDR